MTIGDDSSNCKTCGKVIYGRAPNSECDDCKNSFIVEDKSTDKYINQTWVEISRDVVCIHDNNPISKKQMVALSFENMQKVFNELKKRGIVK